MPFIIAPSNNPNQEYKVFTKNVADTINGSRLVKTVLCASGSNIILTPVEGSSPQKYTITQYLIDGINLFQYSSFLIFGQTDPAQNGIYDVKSVGIAPDPLVVTLERNPNFDTQSNILNSLIQVLYGNTFANTQYIPAITIPFIINEDPITITEYSVDVSVLAVPNTIVKRDESGNILANKFIGSADGGTF